MALIIGDISTVFPLFQACWTFFGVVGGVVYYDRGTVDLGGTACLLMGALLLLQHARAKQMAEDELGPVQDEEKLTLLTISRSNSSAEISASMSRSSSTGSFGDIGSPREPGVPANASPRASPDSRSRQLSPRSRSRLRKPSAKVGSSSVAPEEEEGGPPSMDGHEDDGEEEDGLDI
jgi:hypothetical protein